MLFLSVPGPEGRLLGQSSTLKTSPSAGSPEFSAFRCVARLPIVGQFFPKKRQFWQLFATDQLIETLKTKLKTSEQNEMKVKIHTFFIK